jgi:hypothetical protein
MKVTTFSAHRVVGTVAATEALLHAGLALQRRQAWDAITISGTVVSTARGLEVAATSLINMILQVAGSLVAMLLLLVIQLALRRNHDTSRPVGGLRLAFSGYTRFTSRVHFVLSLGVMAGMMWHVLLQSSSTARIPVFVACCLWLLTQLYRFGRLFIFRGAHASVKERMSGGGAVSLTVQTSHHLRVFPGCYFYVFFQGTLPFASILQGYPAMLCWCEPEELVARKSTAITFLLTEGGPHRLALSQATVGRSLRLDGPYGIDLRLERFETVILAAKGMGIVGVLPYAVHLAARKQHDDNTRHKSARLRDTSKVVFGDLSRCVDLVWWLEDSDQEPWIRSQLKAL